MTRTELLALALRVEAVTGPDRMLDAEIVWRTTPGIIGIERGAIDGMGADVLFRWSPERSWVQSWHHVPDFTASLDAAASLVPNGWHVHMVAFISMQGVWLVTLWRPAGRAAQSYATTEPGARTAAALRAMAEWGA